MKPKGRYIRYEMSGEVMEEDILEYKREGSAFRLQTETGIIICTCCSTRAQFIPFDPHVMNKKIKVLEYSI